MRAIGRPNLPKLRNYMAENKIDSILLINSDPIFDPNIRYFSGFVQEPGGYCCCLLITKKERMLFVSSPDFDRAIEQADVELVVNIKDFDNSYRKAMASTLKKCKKVGIVKSAMSLKLYEDLRKGAKAKFVNVSNFLGVLRAIKLRKEIELVRRSAKITNSGINVVEQALEEVAAGRRVSEKELSLRIENELKRRGADHLGFLTMVGSHHRSSFPHTFPSASDQLIKRGIGFVDFGAVYQGYHTDITVPFTVGKISEGQKRIVDFALEAYDLAINSVHVELPAWKLYQKVYDFLKSNGVEFKHSLGHGLGLSIHEEPSISEKPTDKACLRKWKEVRLKPNMIFTIEPGVYVKNVGGCRIENDILLAKKGAEILTEAKFLEI